MSRFDKAELEGVIESMEKLLQEEIVPPGSGPAAEPSQKDGAAGVPSGVTQASEPVRACLRLRFLF
jgi:hypothetical protein